MQDSLSMKLYFPILDIIKFHRNSSEIFKFLRFVIETTRLNRKFDIFFRYDF